MPKPQYSFSIPTRFELETLEKLREASLQNQRSLSGEIRYRVLKSLQKDADKYQDHYCTEDVAERK